ncbi:MAG: ImmA/IrrE family metallo-endopeptidase [Ignavibacteriales bacterium]|nr:ImmA/IrrE family metallo-endopeptidase [Ignavibacteriales bacterium]
MATLSTIKDKTLELLSKFEITTPPIDIKKIVKGLGLVIEENSFGESVSGLLVSKNQNNVIGINVGESPVRQRFTLAHELGHYCLHRTSKDEFLTISKVDFRNGDSSTGEIKKEREANAFAANLLMPAHMVSHEVSQLEENTTIETAVSLLAKKFNVSEAAMTYRLANLGYTY